MGRRARWPVYVAASALSLAFGCQLLVGLDQPLGEGGIEGGPAADAPVNDSMPDAPAGDTTVADAHHEADAHGKKDGGPGIEASIDGDAGDAAPEAGVDSAPYCPDAAGSASINVGPFCIDATETTNAEYTAFLSTFPPGTLQPSECQSWNLNYTPPGWPPSPSKASYPVTNVNWCDAWAYCAWAGKRLCGNIDGGPAPFTAFSSPTNEHYFACSLDGGQKYPYGTTYKPTDCNVPDRDAGRTYPVGYLKACQGAFPGLYDMVGNVMEWQNACDGDAGKSDHCLNGAVAYDKGPSGANAGCTAGGEDTRSTEVAYVGIRCCADVK